MADFLRIIKSSAWIFFINVFLMGLIVLNTFLSDPHQKVFSSFHLSNLFQSRFTFDVMWFAFVLFALGFFLAILSYLIWRYTALGFINRDKKGYGFVVILLLLHCFLWNSQFFPHSNFSLFTGSNVSLVLLLFFSGFTVILFLGRVFFSFSSITAILVLSVLIFGFVKIDFSPPHYRAFNGQPDIIIIGFDSLRPRMVTPQLMPALHHYLSEASVYENAYTPLARTYPSWMSILSGLYPQKHGARFNLMPRSLHNPDCRLLPAVLADQGYESLYAADEKRFANIDGFHGFKYVVGPGIGASDFVIGLISDTPLVNLVRQISLSRLLLPYVYSNRAADASYSGHVFANEVGRGLAALNRLKPTLIAIHFCEAHYPFTPVERGDKALSWYQPQLQDNDPFQQYRKSLNNADNQFAHVLASLKDAGRLENALIFLISDHGEAFVYDTLVFNSLAEGGKKYALTSFGHGTNAADTYQFKVLLAIRQFKNGHPSGMSGHEKIPVSLVDIYPTILNYLTIPCNEKKDGISLLSKKISAKRDFYVETGFNIPALMNYFPDMRDVFMQGYNAYEVNRQGYITIKKERIPGLIAAKEVSVIRGDQMVVFKSTSQDSGQFTWFDHTRQLWQPLNQNDKWSGDIYPMISSLCKHFSDHSKLQQHPFCQTSNVQ